MVDFDNTAHGSSSHIGYKIIGRKSWVSYIGFLFRYALIFGVLIYIDTSIATTPEFLWINEYIFYVYAFFSVLFIYKLAVLRSYKVSVTDEGVWLHYGILPWAKGGNGLRWNDADMAFYYPGFVSWITNSYTITVKHKYTNSSDFLVSHIWRGRKVCSDIASIQRNRLGV